MPAAQDHVTPETPPGAHLVPGGATFKVWAPGALAVYLVWRRPDEPETVAQRPAEGFRLVRDEAGFWTGFFPGVTESSLYRFWTVGPGGEGFKRDPRARELELGGYPEVDCVVRGPNEYPWHDEDFRPPAFNDLILYQLHIGVFYAASGDGQDIRHGRVSKFLDVLGRLEYLVELGVNAIQPLPVVEWQGCSAAATTIRIFSRRKPTIAFLLKSSAPTSSGSTICCARKAGPGCARRISIARPISSRR